jgi:hypothetical protein
MSILVVALGMTPRHQLLMVDSPTPTITSGVDHPQTHLVHRSDLIVRFV